MPFVDNGDFERNVTVPLRHEQFEYVQKGVRIYHILLISDPSRLVPGMLVAIHECPRKEMPEADRLYIG